MNEFTVETFLGRTGPHTLKNYLYKHRGSKFFWNMTECTGEGVMILADGTRLEKDSWIQPKKILRKNR